MTLSHNGGTYELTRTGGAAAHLEATGPTWQLLRDGAPVTTFPANPGESESAVRDKALEWLRAQDDRPAADINRN